MGIRDPHVKTPLRADKSETLVQFARFASHGLVKAGTPRQTEPASPDRNGLQHRLDLVKLSRQGSKRSQIIKLRTDRCPRADR